MLRASPFHTADPDSASNSLGALDEVHALERLLEQAPPGVEVRRVCEVESDGRRLPVYAIGMGNPARDSPAVGFFGGVHGLERIGTQLLLRFLGQLLARWPHDRAMRQRLEHVRLVFMPLVNPGGMLRATRCNPRGVDLMRNAPVQASMRVPFMLGGQRLSAMLPWYRGRKGAAMESESEALCQLVEDELLDRNFSLALDCHSGFGFRDRIWFPFAHTRTPIRHVAEIHALSRELDRQWPQHQYVFEPQSRQYTTHGDLWDHLYQRSLVRGRGVFLPLTLELGSWHWIRKYPRQVFSRIGLFNPIAPARQERVLQRHLPCLDIFARLGGTWNDWLPSGAVRMVHQHGAMARWYAGAGS